MTLGGGAPVEGSLFHLDDRPYDVIILGDVTADEDNGDFAAAAENGLSGVLRYSTDALVFRKAATSESPIASRRSHAGGTRGCPTLSAIGLPHSGQRPSSGNPFRV